MSSFETERRFHFEGEKYEKIVNFENSQYSYIPNGRPAFNASFQWPAGLKHAKNMKKSKFCKLKTKHIYNDYSYHSRGEGREARGEEQEARGEGREARRGEAR